MGQTQVVLGGTILLVHTAPRADLIIPTMSANHSIVHSGTPQMQHSITMHKMHLQTSTLALNATRIQHPPYQFAWLADYPSNIGSQYLRIWVPVPTNLGSST